MVALLSGGTGGAKLARGLLEVVGPRALAVVANTGDDVEVYGVHVSPDPDLVTYWLADVIDERGWGIEGDTWNVMSALDEAGADAWFRLGDRDLAMCLVRTALLRAGDRLTSAQAEVARCMGVEARVLPMADEPVRSHVMSGGRWRPFQEFMIRERAAAPIEGLEVRGAADARPTPEVSEVLAAAEAILIGPSNPVVSIGPILAVPGIREALSAAPAPVVAVSPFVGGRAVKGPTEAFFEHTGRATGASGVAEAYSGLIDGLVTDEAPTAAPVPIRQVDTLMETQAARSRLASITLDFAASLAG